MRYHGGKWLLAPWIISHFPKHKVYVEPFGGAGSVLLRKHRSAAEVYNDVWDEVVNLFEVLRDELLAKKFESQVRLTPFARSEFENSYHPDENLDKVEKARRLVLRSFMGFGSAAVNDVYRTGFRYNSTRKGGTPSHDWSNYPDIIEDFTTRLKGVIIENRPAIDVMIAHDSKDTLHYIDPPYLHETRSKSTGSCAYRFELSRDEHIELLESIKSLKGMIILSGYQSELYDDSLSGWTKKRRKCFADGARERTEVIWMNPRATEMSAQTNIFSQSINA